MIKRQELSDESSALNRAGEDEPIFVLRANDELAADHVLIWAEQYFQSKLKEPGGITSAQLVKYRDALAIADAMLRWRAEHTAGALSGRAALRRQGS